VFKHSKVLAAIWHRQRSLDSKPRQNIPNLELIQVFPLASIQSEEHLAAALQVLDNVSSREGLDDGEELYLDALSGLVGTYEDVHYPIAPSSHSDMLRHLMEAKGMSRASAHFG